METADSRSTLDIGKHADIIDAIKIDTSEINNKETATDTATVNADPSNDTGEVSSQSQLAEDDSKSEVLGSSDPDMDPMADRIEVLGSSSGMETGELVSVNPVAAEVLLAFIISSSLQLWGVQDNWKKSKEEVPGLKFKEVLKDVDLGDTAIKLSNYEAVQVSTAASNVCVLEPGSKEDVLDLAEEDVIVIEPKMELISSKSKEEFGLVS